MSEDAAKAARHQANVIWFDQMKGYGFLKVAGYPNDLFFHSQAVTKAGIPVDSLLNGAALRCNIGTHKGKPCATDLELP